MQLFIYFLIVFFILNFLPAIPLTKMKVFIEIPGTIVIRNRKKVWKRKLYLLIFSLELEIPNIWGGCTENTSKQQKIVTFVRSHLVKMILRLF